MDYHLDKDPDEMVALDMYIRELIADANEDDRSTIIDIIGIYNEYTPTTYSNNRPFFDDVFSPLISYVEQRETRINELEFYASSIIYHKELLKKIYSLLGDDFCTKETFERYYYTDVEKIISNDSKCIKQLKIYYTDNQLRELGIEI